MIKSENALRELFLIIFLIIFFGNISSAQKKESCYVKYNEFDEKGKEHEMLTIAWFDLLPEIPAYTYFDKDLGKKVVIKTTITAYKNEIVANLNDYKIKAGEYAVILLICPDNSEKQLLNLEQLLPDYNGENLAFEVKPGDNSLTFYCFVFENDFPFKFE